MHRALPRALPSRRSQTVGHVPRPVALAIILALTIATAGGCGPEPGPLGFHVANDSDSTVFVNADTHGTVSVPAKSRTAWLFGGHTPGGWKIEVVDADCHPRVTFTVSDRDAWLYVAPDGQASLSELTPTSGLTETSATLLPSQCPRPRER